MASRKHPSKSPSRSKRTQDIRVSARIHAKPAAVYRALTSAKELCAWWLEKAESDARSLGRLRMIWPAEGGAPAEARGVFVDLEPGKKVAWIIEDKWRAKGVPALASIFILEEGSSCVVTAVQSGFPAGSTAARLMRGDWEDCLAKLKLYLETGRRAKDRRLTLSEAEG